MGIQVEFNPSLALREDGTEGRLEAERIPKKLEVGKIYPLRKEGQRNYWLEDEIPLVITRGNQQLSRPIASVIVLEETHFFRDGRVYTEGRYIVKEVYDPNDPTIHFEGMEKIR